MTEWWRKLRGWLRRGQLAAELDEEIQTHLAMKTANGADSHTVQKQFGNRTAILEDSRNAWGWPRPEAWMRDLRYGVRMMLRRPGFALTVIAILALGIGATVTIFSIVDTVVIRPLSYEEPDRLVSIREVTTTAERRETGVAPGRLEDWNRLNSAFEGLAGCYMDSFTETSGTRPERVTGAFVSPGFFPMLRASALAGRTFSAEEERFGGPAVVILSYEYWRRRFDSDPRIVGQKLPVSGQSYEIIGVMPSTFQYPVESTDVWIPKQIRPEVLRIRAARFYRFTVGRIKSGRTIEQARADLESVQAKLAEQYPQTDAEWTVHVEPLKERQVGRYQLALWLMFASAALLLLIACTNVASLLLAQFSARTEEVATRLALGASRAAIARQLFAEGLAYALAGSLGGVLLTYWAVAMLRQQLSNIPRIANVTVDWRVLAFAAITGAAVATLVSLAPMIQTARRGEGMVRASRGVVGRSQRLPRALVSAQLALATVLLVGSGLFFKTLLSLQQNDLGFRAGKVLTLRVSASFAEASQSVAQRHQRLIDSISSIPGVQVVGMSDGLPGTAPAQPTQFRIAGQENAGDDDHYAAQRVISSGYFQSIGIPILSGSTCEMHIEPKPLFEILVNQAFVNRFLQQRDPIGLSIIPGARGTSPGMRIVGVVADIREGGYTREPEPVIYTCGYLRFWPDSNFLIQTRGAPETMAQVIREKIEALEPDRAVYEVAPLAEVLTGTLSQERFRAGLISVFSAIALTLAAVGVYGVSAYMVSQRVREFGVRMALGAKPRQIWQDTLSSGGRLALIGAATGIAMAFAATRLIATLLYGVGTFDVFTYLSAAAVLFTAAMLACILPGRRATSIDPARVLRDQ